MKIALTAILFTISITSCKKESINFELPDEFNGPSTEHSQFYGNWIWIYSNSPSTAYPPMAENIRMEIKKDSVKFSENGTDYFYFTKSTLEDAKRPFVHYFNFGTYLYSSSIDTLNNQDSIILKFVNGEAGMENDLVFKKQ